MKNAFFSKEAIKYLQSMYPHVTEAMFNGLLSMFELKPINKSVNNTQIIESRHALLIPTEISNALGIDNEITFSDKLDILYYVPEKNIDAVDALKYAYEHMNERNGNPLLTIELVNEESVPKVFYEGEKITKKIRVSFDWETETDEFGGTRYNIEHYVTGHGFPTRRGYRLERGKYEFEGDN
ncbi:hypothetical protein [Gracilibacillus salinarum]|uniref:Phage portal protein n=1 Tax=Gracilibacillus salinarum TaxID=2932255 RepID=A0ABY4GNA7_9BACI|nr:hypothetical protein [Gracilibacillus salinarum]UOQ85683.1 hypothetical protein MUN87_01890 [Gracilibacillus salinarum]